MELFAVTLAVTCQSAAGVALCHRADTLSESQPEQLRLQIQRSNICMQRLSDRIMYVHVHMHMHVT